jgi:hypothetical protein
LADEHHAAQGYSKRDGCQLSCSAPCNGGVPAVERGVGLLDNTWQIIA